METQIIYYYKDKSNKTLWTPNQELASARAEYYGTMDVYFVETEVKNDQK